MRYQIYRRGFHDMGCLPNPSCRVGEGHGETFKEACANFYSLKHEGVSKHYDPVTNTYFGRKLGQSLASVALPGEFGNGPDVGDGLDSDGFPGGDRRMNAYPTTRESALQALLDFIPKEHRRETEVLINEVLEVTDEAIGESDEEE